MKIVSLQSAGLGDCDEAVEGVHPIPLIISIGHVFPFGFEGVPIKLIELVDGNYTGINALDAMKYATKSMETLYYKVTTSDGHIRMLPEQSYIAEWAEAEDDK